MPVRPGDVATWMVRHGFAVRPLAPGAKTPAPNCEGPAIASRTTTMAGMPADKTEPASSAVRRKPCAAPTCAACSIPRGSASGAAAFTRATSWTGFAAGRQLEFRSQKGAMT